MSFSLDKLSKSLKKSKNVFELLESGLTSAGYTPETIEKCYEKGFLPYEYINETTIKATNFPEKGKFFNSLTSSTITDEEYKHAKNLFITAKCTNLQDYIELYLLTDVLLLGEIFLYFRNSEFSEQGLDACAMTTLPSLAMECALKISKVEISLLSDIEVYSNLECSVRGGITSAVQGKCTFNNPSLDNFDPDSPIFSGIFVDVNSLYATILSGKLPFSKFHLINNEEEIKFFFC